MKKKAFALGVAALLIAILSFSTLAWFTDNDSTTNVFEVGSVEIIQHEKEHDDAGNLQDFTQNKVLMPIVNTADPAANPNYQEKIVTVESQGENPAYVRTHIAVPTALLPVLGLDYSDSTNWAEFTYNAQPTVDVDGINYTVYTFTYTNAIGAGQAQNITDTLLEGVYMLAHTDCQENAQGVMQYCYPDANGDLQFCEYDVDDTVKVLVATQAVQSEGFASAAEAMTAAFADEHPIG